MLQLKIDFPEFVSSGEGVILSSGGLLGFSADNASRSLRQFSERGFVLVRGLGTLFGSLEPESDGGSHAFAVDFRSFCIRLLWSWYGEYLSFVESQRPVGRKVRLEVFFNFHKSNGNINVSAIDSATSAVLLDLLDQHYQNPSDT